MAEKNGNHNIHDTAVVEHNGVMTEDNKSNDDKLEKMKMVRTYAVNVASTEIFEPENHWYPKYVGVVQWVMLVPPFVHFSLQNALQCEPKMKYYEKRVVNAQLASQVNSFISMGNERIICRYCHLHPQVDPEQLRAILSYEPKYFSWSGADLFNVTNSQGDRKMVLIETNRSVDDWLVCACCGGGGVGTTIMAAGGCGTND